MPWLPATKQLLSVKNAQTEKEIGEKGEASLAAYNDYYRDCANRVIFREEFCTTFCSNEALSKLEPNQRILRDIMLAEPIMLTKLSSNQLPRKLEDLASNVHGDACNTPFDDSKITKDNQDIVMFLKQLIAYRASDVPAGQHHNLADAFEYAKRNTPNASHAIDVLNSDESRIKDITIKQVRWAVKKVLGDLPKFQDSKS